jgi:protein-disulfide isomerase
LALAASVALSLQHLGRSGLPGCGLDSACARALGGRFGTLPVADWPLAFAGVSFFAGLLGAWLVGPWTRSMRLVARLGGLSSLALLVVALVQGTPCPYCITAQLANLAFVGLAERCAGPGSIGRAEVLFLSVALASTAGLGLARSRAALERSTADEQALAASTDAVRSGAGARAFTGRYRRGPERAAIRVVLFTDYQCPDCAGIERELDGLLESRSDLSLSVKHFPLCRDCNQSARERNANPHPNACWAARAAEAAGVVAGEDGFWRMHHWLFARKGAFQEPELRAGLAELALDPGAFFAAFQAPETLARVEADVEEAIALGIQSTPLLFLNGVELRGWRAPKALTRAIEALAATKLEAKGADADAPPDALAKALADWRAEPKVAIPARAGAAKPSGTLEVVLWSDYFESSTAELDRRIRAFAAEHPGLTYSFRHYPIDPECVPKAPNLHPGACRLARAAETARVIGGEAAFVELHRQLLVQPPKDEDALRALLPAAGIDAARFLEQRETPAIAALIAADVAAARQLGIRSIPFLFVGGKLVPRWRLDGAEPLEPLLSEALGSR